MKSGGARPESAATQPPRRKPLFRGLYRLILVMLTLFAAMVFVFPAIVGPRIDLPRNVQFASASSLTVQVSNQNLTPLNNLEYTCEISRLTLASGSTVTDAKVLTRGAIPRLDGRRGVAARCQTAYWVTRPVKSAEYTLTLKYEAYPWRRRRTAVYHIAALIDSNAQLTGWKME